MNNSKNGTRNVSTGVNLQKGTLSLKKDGPILIETQMSSYNVL